LDGKENENVHVPKKEDDKIIKLRVVSVKGCRLDAATKLIVV